MYQLLPAWGIGFGFEAKGGARELIGTGITGLAGFDFDHDYDHMAYPTAGF